MTIGYVFFYATILAWLGVGLWDWLVWTPKRKTLENRLRESYFDSDVLWAINAIKSMPEGGSMTGAELIVAARRMRIEADKEELDTKGDSLVKTANKIIGNK